MRNFHETQTPHDTLFCILLDHLYLIKFILLQIFSMFFSLKYLDCILYSQESVTCISPDMQLKAFIRKVIDLSHKTTADSNCS